MKNHTLRGYTLVELTLAISLLGLIAVLLWRFGSVASQRIAETEAPQLLAEANQALAGFVAANHRLPCPDTSGDGVEHCGGATIGRLPVVTLGLARADLQNVHYGVYRNTVSTLVNDVSTTVRVDVDYAGDRFAPLVTVSTVAPDVGYYHSKVSAFETYLGNGKGNGIDFCHALRLAGIKADSDVVAHTVDANALNIRDSGGVALRNIAYALALPGARDADGDGNPFDAANVTPGSFAAPGQPLSATYDDVVQGVDFGQLFDRLSCAGVLSAADHAHFNAATAAALTHAAFVNYKTQLQIAEELAVANVLLATAAVALATADLGAATAGVSFSIAEALLSAGITAPVVIAAVWAETMALAAEALAISGLVVAGLGLDGAKQTVLDFQTLLDQSSTLESEIRTHAFAADAAGLY